MRKKGILFFLFVMLFLPFHVKAASYEVITYSVDVSLHENRTADIQEEYNVYFVDNMSSFTRKLDDKLTTIRPNGTKRVTNLNISNVKVLLNDKSVDYTVDSGKIISNAEHHRDTVDKYTISYTYDYGKDTGIGLDEIFLNLINGTIDANISSIQFKIQLPKEVDASKIFFRYKNSWGNNDVEYQVNENVITGFLNPNLKSNDTFGLYLEFPDNYFVGASDYYNYWIWALLIIPAGTLVFSILKFLKYGKGNKIPVVLEETVPYGFNSAEIAYLYKGYLKEHDLLTVLISLANKDYIHFIESDDGYKLDSINSFVIEKQKDYDGDNASEKLLFDKLFQDKDTITLKDIEYNLYDTLMETKNSIDNSDNHEKVFFKTIKQDKKWLFIAIVISAIAMNFNSIYLYMSNYFLIPIIVGVLVFGIYVLFFIDTKILIKILFGVLPIAFSLYIGIMPLINDIRTLILYLLGMLLIFISSYIYKILPYRTIYGNEVYGRISGFKKSLESMSSSTLSEKQEINSNYFYDMYPYVYVLDGTDIWVRKASNIVKTYPNWYITKEEFSLDNFQKFVKNMIFTVTQAMFKKQLTGQSSVHVEYHRTKTEEL